MYGFNMSFPLLPSFQMRQLKSFFILPDLSIPTTRAPPCMCKLQALPADDNQMRNDNKHTKNKKKGIIM